jgi:flagellar basal body-associated protein FliL
MEVVLVLLLMVVSAAAGAVAFAMYRKKIAEAAKAAGDKLEG